MPSPAFARFAGTCGILAAAAYDADFLCPVLWDISAYQGKTARLRVFDGSKDAHYCDGVTGQNDLDNCSSPTGLYASEQANYGGCFAASVVLGSGHDLTTEAEAPVAAAEKTAPADFAVRGKKCISPALTGQDRLRASTLNR